MQPTTIALLCILGAWGAYILYGFAFWYREGKRMQKSGYLPPRPSFFGRSAAQVICRILAFLGVGPIKVTGRENTKYDGPLLITGNHQFELDFSVVGSSVPYAFRQLASANEVKGFRAPLAAWSGNFAVHVEHGKAQPGESGNAVVETCAKVLKHRRARLLMFLQGYLDRECKFDPADFRTGAVRAMQRARELGSENVAVLPMAIFYQRTPTHTLLSKLGTRHMFGPRNFGASVAIGKPIPITTLPADPRAATEVLRVEIARLYEVAKAL
jgi:1-acyl-sn-glycerol-3-phosphate acyltransferase